MLVGRYQLLFRLGKGGMGEVWAAAQSVSELGFQKLIALKVLRSKDLTSNAAVMFYDEAKAASVLQHAAIVPTVDLGRDDDILYIAMDLVRGPSLTALLQRLVINKAAMSPAIVAHIGMQIASALDYAADRATFQGKPLKLVHRDVSPHNVLLDLNGTVRLTDFGVARTAIQSHESHVGTVRGKPSYMAPEQVVGGDIDNRTDLFSLGIVLYESASLKRLFGRSNPVKSMDAVLKHTPKPLPELVPGFPPALWNVIARALEKDPHRRYQRAAEFQEALAEASRSLDGASSAARDLCALIGKNFPSDAFDIDGRVAEAMAVATAVVEQANRPQETAIAHDGTRSMRGRAVAETFVGQLGTRVTAWPTAHAPDPLAPEAIEEARTQFAAMTPSGLQIGATAVQYMTSMPSIEGVTPLTTNHTFTHAVVKPSSGLSVVTGLIVAAALILLVTVVVVVRTQDASAPAAEIVEAAPIEAPAAAVRATAKPVEKPQPAAQPEPAAVLTAEETDAAADAAARERKRGKRAAANAAKTEEEPKRAAEPVAQNATKDEVLALIRKVRDVDPERAKKMIPTLNEAGDDNVAVLNDLRAQARAILADKK
jgi:eukaryotic-like serine/threonine-protein kinase